MCEFVCFVFLQKYIILKSIDNVYIEQKEKVVIPA